jgi:hypothetical protein
MTLSRFSVRRHEGPVRPDWGSDRRPSRTVSHLAWGRLLVLPLGLVSLSHVHGSPFNIGVAAG